MVRRLSVVVAAIACAAVPAQEPGGLAALVARAEVAQPAAEEFRQLRVAPSTTYDAVRDVVRSLDWHDRLPAARRAAAADGRPIVWIQALGDLEGYT